MSDLVLLVRSQLDEIEREMQAVGLWQKMAPSPDAFDSVEPFYIDRMEAHTWLQWVFIPKMRVLIETGAPLPMSFSLSPYFEEVLKKDEYKDLLLLIKKLDDVFC